MMKIVYCHFKDAMKHCSSWRCLLTPSFTQASTQGEIDCPFLSASAVWTKTGGVTEPHLQQRFKSILHLAQLLPSSFLHFHFTRKIANCIYPCKAWLCHSGSQLIIDFLLMISPVTPAHSTVDEDFVFTKLYWSIEVVAERLVCFSPQQILPLCVPKQTVLPNSGALLLTTLHQNYTTERKKKMQSAQDSWLTV